MVRGRLVDPTGAFVTYAGQYQPEALAALERADPPGFFALTGKARTYEPEDGDRIYSSVRPESVSEVDGDTRDRWVVTAAERTVERVGVMASAIESGLTGGQLRTALREAGVDDRLADGVALALDHYGTTPAYLSELRDVALDAVRVVAGERDEGDRLELAPGEGAGDAGALATIELSGEPAPETAADAGESGIGRGRCRGIGDRRGWRPGDRHRGLGRRRGAIVRARSGTGGGGGRRRERRREPTPSNRNDGNGRGVGSDVGGEPSADAEPDDESPDEASPDPDIDSEPETVDGATDAPSETTADPDDAIGDFDGTDDGIGESEEAPIPRISTPASSNSTRRSAARSRTSSGRSSRPPTRSSRRTSNRRAGPARVPRGGPARVPSRRLPAPIPTTRRRWRRRSRNAPPDTAGEPTAAGDEGSAPADEVEEAVDLDDAVMALMSDLDDGDGVDRDPGRDYRRRPRSRSGGCRRGHPGRADERAVLRTRRRHAEADLNARTGPR